MQLEGGALQMALSHVKRESQTHGQTPYVKQVVLCLWSTVIGALHRGFKVASTVGKLQSVHA